MKLFIDPGDTEAGLRVEPGVAAGADGCVGRRPELLPREAPEREAARHHALRAVDGAELHRGQHRRRHREGESGSAAGVLREGRRRRSRRHEPVEDETSTSSRAARTARPIAPANTVGHHALLLINPHTSFFFRSELQMTSDEGLNAYGASTWGQFFIYQGFNEHVGWMHTSSAVDAIDEYLETVTKKGDGYVYKHGSDELPVSANRSITVPYKTRAGHGREDVHGLPHAARPGRPRDRTASGSAFALMTRAGEGADAVLHAHQGDGLQVVPPVDGAAHQLVEQHDLRRRRRRHRVLPRQLHSEARSEVRLDASRSTAAIRRRTGRACSRSTRRRTCSIPRAAGSTTPTTGRGRPPGRAARRRRTFRPTSTAARSRRAACTRSACCRTGRTSRSTGCSPRRTTAT